MSLRHGSNGRRRVLVEAPAPWHFAFREASTMVDCAVRLCGGPRSGPDRTCPVLAGRPCALVRDSDVVVCGLGLDTPEARGIVSGLRVQHPDVPLVVLAWRSDTAAHADLLADATVVTFPWTTRKVCDAVRAAR